jgi:hypothetical protein
MECSLLRAYSLVLFLSHAKMQFFIAMRSFGRHRGNWPSSAPAKSSSVWPGCVLFTLNRPTIGYKLYCVFAVLLEEVVLRWLKVPVSAQFVYCSF